MRKHEFYEKYANTPIENRFIIINIAEFGLLTLNDIYKEIKKIDEQIRPLEIRRQKLLDIFPLDKNLVLKSGDEIKINITLSPQI